jgi:hypothetical protein
VILDVLHNADNRRDRCFRSAAPAENSMRGGCLLTRKDFHDDAIITEGRGSLSKFHRREACPNRGPEAVRAAGRALRVVACRFGLPLAPHDSGYRSGVGCGQGEFLCPDYSGA